MNIFLSALNTFYRENISLSLYFAFIFIFMLLEILFLIKASWVIFKIRKKLENRNFKKEDFLTQLIKEYRKLLKININNIDSYIFIKNYLEKKKNKIFRGIFFIENSPSLYILAGLLGIIFIFASSLLGTEYTGLESIKNLYSSLDIIIITIIFSIICSLFIKIIIYVFKIREKTEQLIVKIKEYLDIEIQPYSSKESGEIGVIYEFMDMVEKKLSNIEERICRGLNEIACERANKDFSKSKDKQNSLKILHSADIHIGLKFENYDQETAKKLTEARFEVLERLINIANEEGCNIFVVSGDLFDSTDINEKHIFRVIDILNVFTGETVLILPGNHDYYNNKIELWKIIARNSADNVILLNKYKPYKLNEWGLAVTIFPAYCDSEKGKENRIDWINDRKGEDNNLWYIGVAHGTLQDKFPDMKYNYFVMNEAELEKFDLDLWLIGHTHEPYPEQRIINDKKIFNAGTPEIDSRKRKHSGNAWLININEEKEITAIGLRTGKYKGLIFSNNKQKS